MSAPAKKPSLASFRRGLRAEADPVRARSMAPYIGVVKGGYGEGDSLLGLTVPHIRVTVRAHESLSDAAIAALTVSRWHEERLAGFLLLVRRYEKGDAKERCRVFDWYLANAERADNWDIVDSSAYQIVGRQLRETGASTAALDRLAKSKNLWRRRIAIVSTLSFIRTGDLAPTFRIAEALLGDTHPLIHKAVGWMLREAGKRDKAALVRWLKPRYRTLPRTALRYAIERFSPIERGRYLAGAV